MHAERLTAQMLAGPPARDPVEVTRRLLAVQGQDPRGARLSAGKVTLEPFARIAAKDEAALRVDAEDVLRFLDANRG